MSFRFESKELYEHPCEFKVRGACMLQEGSCYTNSKWSLDQLEECPKEQVLLSVRSMENLHGDTVSN